MKLNINSHNLGILAIEIFFILSFLLVTYSTNIYILWGLVIFTPMILFAKQKTIFPIILLMLIITIMPLYGYLNGFQGIFRVIKTLVIMMSMVLIYSYNQLRYHIHILHYFMIISAVLVCVDFVLYITVGRTIMVFTTSGFMPRPQGLMEDSNFFSYTMVSYILYLKFAYGKPTKLFITSVLCSGSISAIVMLFISLFIYKNTKINKINKGTLHWQRWRNTIIFAVLSIHICYFSVVTNKDEIINYIKEQKLSPLLEIKAISMFMRFDAQKTAIDQIASQNKEILGGGPGITKTLNERSMNLHNTFYQIYVEMGMVLIIIIAISLFYYMLKIKSISFLFLFAMMSLFGNMLEVFYSPIMPFIFFLYKIVEINNNYDASKQSNTYCYLPK